MLLYKNNYCAADTWYNLQGNYKGSFPRPTAMSYSGTKSLVNRCQFMHIVYVTVLECFSLVVFDSKL